MGFRKRKLGSIWLELIWVEMVQSTLKNLDDLRLEIKETQAIDRSIIMKSKLGQLDAR